MVTKIVAITNITLDGVMQAPGAPDEDVRGGFTHGGWALPYNDPVMAEAMGEGMAKGMPLLFGRRTYENFYAYWPNQRDNPYTDVLNKAQKYVASRTLTEPLPWENSTLVKGEAAQTVAELKAQPGEEIGILGSGELVRSLMQHNLIDEYMLLIHPLVLGSGQRLFSDGTSFPLELGNTVTTTTGVIIATYRPVTTDRQAGAQLRNEHS
jgi:dihydrofolate reductase